MHQTTAAMLLAVDKHHAAGALGLIVGILVLAYGAVRVAARMAGAAAYLAAGLVIAILGILLYVRVL